MSDIKLYQLSKIGRMAITANEKKSPVDTESIHLMLEAQGERAIAFDIGGVLIDGGVMSSTGENGAFLTLEERFGIPHAVGAQIWHDLLDVSERGDISEAAVFEALAAAGANCDPSAVRQALLDMAYPVSSTVSVLEYLHKRGWRTAAASNHLMEWAAEWSNNRCLT